MKENNDLDENQRILIQAFKLQNQQAYDQAREKLQVAADTLIRIIEKIQSSSEFYMRHMQLMKEERDLVCEKDYKEFLLKNDKTLSRNFQKNAYLALLMQEIQDRETQGPSKKWANKEEQIMKRSNRDGNMSPENVQSKFRLKEESRKKQDQIKLGRDIEKEQDMEYE